MVTLITRASSGIDEELSRRYVTKKCEFVLVVRRQDKLDALAGELREGHGVEVTTISLDLPESDATQRLWNETGRRGLYADVLVSNAGSGTGKDVADDASRRLEQEVRLNCLVVVGLTARYLSAMHKCGNGTIINTSPAAAFQPILHMAVYRTTKVFVLSSTEALWRETRRDNIHVLAVCLGSVNTLFFQVVDEGTVVGRLRSTRQVLDTTT